MIRKLLITLLLGFACLFSNAQYTQIGTGFFSSANFGPLRTDVTPSYYSKFAYTYPDATLGDLQSGDTITSLGFFFDSFDSLIGSCNMRILLAPSVDADFGPQAINWDSISRSDAVEVYNGNPKTIIGNIAQEVIFPLDQPYRWDTAGGRVNLRVFVEYIQTTNQTAVVQWNVENGTSVVNFLSNNESKFIYGASTLGIDSITNRTSIIKPTLKLYYPRYSQDMEVSKIYSLGTVPTLMNRADTIKARLTNVGSDTFGTSKVYLMVRGANTHLDSAVVSNVAPLGQAMIHFSNHIPTTIGTETLVVKIGDDDNDLNDSLAKLRDVDYNVYSHYDAYTPAGFGGISIGGGTGDFVAKFYVGGTSYINQIKVDFNSSNVPFQLIVLDDDGTDGKPGTPLFVSDTSLTVNGTYIMPVLPRIAVSGGYYVGIRQTTTAGVSFAYQDEKPIRSSSFYFTAPAGDTSWVNFDPGYNFNFNIRPRLQVANDVAVLDIISPVADSNILYSETDSIELVARIINFGYLNQGSFIVRGQLYNQFNQLIETRNQFISLGAEDTAFVNFGPLANNRLGDYTFRVTTLASLDSVTDNNQKEIDFSFIIEYDVAVDIFFGPSAGTDFDIFRDPLQAIVRVSNNGVIPHTDMPVILQLVNANDDVVYTQTQLIDIDAQSTKIVLFDTTYLTSAEEFTIRAYTQLALDSFRNNDTLSVFPIRGIKTDDVQMTVITRPINGQKFAKNESMRPFVRYLNDGRNRQDSVIAEAFIYNDNDEVIYYDSIHQSVSFFSIKQALFQSVTLDSLGDYTFFTRVTIPNDQLPDNDTASTRFSVVTGNDLRLISVLNPKGVVAINSADDNVRVVVFNAGLNDVVSAPFSISIENNEGATIYSDVSSITLASGVTDTIDFKVLSFSDLGDFYVTVTNDWSLEDEPLSSDTLNGGYVTRYKSDVGIVSHLLPIDTIEIGEVTRPRFSILNSGIDTAKNLSVKVNILNNVGTVLFADTVSPPNMGNNILFNLNTNKTWSWNDGGVFTLRSEILNTDNNLANNVLASTFVVAKRRDLAVVRADGPVNAENVVKGSIYKPVAVFKNVGLQDVVGAEVVCDVKIGLITIYRNKQPMNLAVGASATIEFDSTMSYPKIAEATAEFRVEYDQDQVASNDTLITTFNFVQGASISELSPQLVEVFPNPVISSFELRTSLIISKVNVKNDLGVTVSTVADVNTSVLTISTEKLSPGTYYLEIITNKGVVSKPLIKL